MTTQVVSLVCAKGGVGKSSTALCLAVEATRRGQKSAVIDLDPLASSSEWSDRRKELEPTVTSLQVARLGKAVAVAKTSGIRLLFVDSAPSSSDATLTICDASNLILIPVRPAIFDLTAIGATARLVRGSAKPGYVFLNGLPHKAPVIERDARDAASQHGLAVAPVVLHQWSAIRNAQLSGQTAQEIDPRGKAAAEIATLYDWTLMQLSDKS